MPLEHTIIFPPSSCLVYTNASLQSQLSKLILITFDRSFQMEYISFLNEVWEEREAKPNLLCWALSK